MAVPEIAVDPALIDEVVSLTASLIQKRAENPPGNEARVVDVLQARLAAAGIAVEVKPFAGPGRTNLLARLPGRDPKLPPVVLLAHSDVVPAEPAAWKTGAGPWDGTIAGGALVGRGALDMLSMDALSTLALVALKDAGVKPLRDVVVVVTGDEEVSGAGVKAAIDAWPQVFQRGAQALTEGSFFFESMLVPGEDIAAVAVAEKGLFQVRLQATGAGGHGSTPLPDAAPDRIVRAARRVVDRPVPLRITTPVAATFAGLGKSRGGLDEFVLGNPSLMRLIAKDRLTSTPTTRALVTDTCALTMLDAGQKANVIPSLAQAVFDCRLLPGTDPARFRDELLVVIDDPHVELTVIEQSAANGSAPDGVFVQAIRARMQRELPSVPVLPILTKAATDARFLRPLGVDVYGFVPVRVTADELDSIHGEDERVRVDELKKALPRLVDIVAAVASSPVR